MSTTHVSGKRTITNANANRANQVAPSAPAPGTGASAGGGGAGVPGDVVRSMERRFVMQRTVVPEQVSPNQVSNSWRQRRIYPSSTGVGNGGCGPVRARGLVLLQDAFLLLQQGKVVGSAVAASDGVSM